jgi:Protein of unknown function (DUF2795)
MGMTEVWNFRDEALARIDVSGFKVRARDAEIGRVAVAIEAPLGGYLVIDPGVSMPLGKQLLLPAGLVEKVDIDRRRVVVGADRKQIENAPEYDPGQPLDDQSRSALGKYFQSLLEQLSEGSARPRTRSSSSRRTATRQRGAGSRGRARATRSSRSRPRTRTADQPTKEELYKEARKLDIPGRSKMSKAQLSRAVSRRKQSSGRASSGKAKATPVAVQSFLEGVGYPTGKRQLLREAESRRASRDVRTTLRRLPDKQFKSPTDVSKAIGRLG